ncbi:hypothetical protein COO60DRAFT_1623933 [Scenedesmus sp. NREL 46B-D3]|nr:hypothetical protein COO60DRAFT_1623933 [Scenedesmus sp. NREL 46B-D3]
MHLNLTKQLQHRRVRCCDSVSGPSAADIVSTVLDKVQGTDGGISMQPEQKREVDGLISQLEAAGCRQPPLQDPLLFGNYIVAYTSSGDDQKGQPRHRHKKVTFKLLGVLPGAVGLRGTLVPVEAGQPHGRGTAGEGDTVRVLFEPPVLSLGTGLHFRIGPPSSVQLSTPYLDERVRLGKGSRGSLFVFTRGGAADEAGMDRVGIEPSTKSGVAWLTAALLGMLVGGWGLWSTGVLAARLLAGSVWLLAALLLAVLQQGGIVRDADDIQRVGFAKKSKQKKNKQKKNKKGAADDDAMMADVQQPGSPVELAPADEQLSARDKQRKRMELKKALRVKVSSLKQDRGGVRLAAVGRLDLFAAPQKQQHSKCNMSSSAWTLASRADWRL